jgi:phthalate 4,5-dioxygenase oxygenase subunit
VLSGDNERLTRVGPDTEMGRLMRSYWAPALCSYEVEPGGKPKPFRLFGEDLVAFRDDDGQVGILEAHCPHRCAPLELARNEGGALTCIFHGWRIGKDGSVLDTPNEPEESRMKERIRHTSYPLIERNGMIWAYLGPDGEPPAFPVFEFSDLAPTHCVVIKSIIRCNWLQIIEGFVDSSHANFLHRDLLALDQGQNRAKYVNDADSILSQPTLDGRVKIRTEDTPSGFRYGAIRKPAANPDQFQYVKVTPFVMPFYTFIPAGAGKGIVNITVPLDDYNTGYYNIKYSFEDALDEDILRRQAGRVWDVDIDRDHNRTASRENCWMQDRDAMQAGTTYVGLTGSHNQDAAVAEGMGYIVDRSKEHLGTADRAVLHLRQFLLEALATKASGGVAPGEGMSNLTDIRAEDGLIPIDGPWQTVNVQLADS